MFLGLRVARGGVAAGDVPSAHPLWVEKSLWEDSCARVQPVASAPNHVDPPKFTAKAFVSCPSGKGAGCAVTTWDKWAPCLVQLTKPQCPAW